MQYDDEQVVCPPNLLEGIFSAGMVDNVDHNPSSRTAKDPFHGMGISVVQFPTCHNPGHDRGIKIIDHSLPMTRNNAPSSMLHGCSTCCSPQ